MTLDYRPLGQTGITVSSLALGTMTWGEQNTEADGHAQLDRATDFGITLIDTAESYSIPPRAETQGSTERIIGSWLKTRGGRDRIVLASKVAGPSDRTYMRADGAPPRLDAKNITEAVEASLRRLGTDYIDLYQIHWPSRALPLFGGGAHAPAREGLGAEVSIEETLEALSSLVTAGKVRHIGLSNETAWGLSRFLGLAERQGLPRVVSVQNAYNLLNRKYETGLAEFHERERVGLLAYSPLAQGFLTGKYQNGARPEKARLTLFDRGARYQKPGVAEAVDAYLRIARDFTLDPAQLAIAFVTSRPFVTSNIIGATTLEQLETDLRSVDVRLTSDLEARIAEVYQKYGSPAP